jgi:Xaa-Pro aminopeptidase
MNRLRAFLHESQFEAILVSHLPNIRYLCGFSGSAGLLLVDPAAATLFTDSRYALQSRQEVEGARTRICARGLIRAAGESLRTSRGRRRVGFSSSCVTVAQRQALESAAGSRVRWVSDQGVVEKLRAVKDASEVATMRQAAALISRVLEATIPSIRPGVSELEVAAKIEFEIKHGGGSGPSFETIVASGARSAWAHARPTAKRLGKNELVVLDQGAILRGYCSDMTRTVFIGRAPRKIRHLYEAVSEAQAAAKSAIRPGARAGDIDRAARRVLTGKGFGRYFTHSTGHGLGLEVHESPRIGRREDTELRPDMVLTVEPGVYLEGLGGIRIEDDVLVTTGGAEDITTSPRNLIEL